MKTTSAAILAASAMLAGCVACKDAATSTEFENYMALCGDLARRPAVESSNPDDPMSKPDWMVGSPSSTREFRKDYRVVYADEKFLSFYAEEYSYEGGPHGYTQTKCGTFCRKTGRRLSLDDVFAESEREELARKLRAEVAKKLEGGETTSKEVKPTENFYFAADGWHFVYNPYEVAAYSEGTIEVVVK